MTKIYEALEQADRDRVESKKPPETPPVVVDSSGMLDFNIEERAMTELYQNIISKLPDKKCRIIQFIGATEGVGTSTTIREFAKVTAIRLKKSILLIDTNNRKPNLTDFFNVKPKSFELGKTHKDSYCQIGISSLFIGQISTNGSSPKFDTLFAELKQDFELILICSPAIMINQDDITLSGLVDGIVLVVEAEKTRWQVVDIVKERIELQGGNILGVILNKRRFHIPKSIYKRI